MSKINLGSKPSLYIDKDLPLEDKVGKTVTAQVTLKVKSRTENDKGKGKGKPKCSYQLDIVDIDFDKPDNGHITASANLDRKVNY
jgi:hypothetical protein